MEFRVHGIPWNSMDNIPWNSVWYWDMEFHVNISTEFYGVPKSSIPWNSVWYWDMEFHGILRKHNLWNSMVFHKSSTPCVLSSIGTSTSMKKYPWISIEN